MNYKKRGFTLIETILSIVVIIALGAAFLLYFMPRKSLPEVRNTERSAETNDVLRAVLKYRDDHSGTLSESITENYKEICRTSGDACAGLVDLSVLVQNNYISVIPADPQYAGDNGSGYEIKKDATGRVYVNAPKSEKGVTVSVTRQ